MRTRQRLAVLKFGGSVLQSDRDLERAAQEIYRWRRDGFHVLAVVSAIGDTTDQLCDQVRRFGTGVDSRKTAQLLATGELQSAALLGLALDRAGISSVTCDETLMGLQTTGDPLDAAPTAADTSVLQGFLADHGVVVVPGFIGRATDHRMCLLGRGGSDLTALFLAGQLNAEVCRLIKDVSGLYEYDPRSAVVPPRRFSKISYRDALQLDETIIQHKGIRFAQSRRLRFEVGELYAACGTVVGDFDSGTFATEKTPPAPLRLAILGLGTVGQGVFDWVNQHLHDRFRITRVAVRDITKAVTNGIPGDCLTGDVQAAIQSDCDIVVELTGDPHLPEIWIASALENGKHVITANKAVMARAGHRLQTLARRHGVTLACSAAVGGAAPFLEEITNVTARGRRINAIAGVVSGSTNFILDCVFAGASFEDSVAAARRAGLMEADPDRDLEGIDAAEKLVLLVRQLGHDLSLDQVRRQPLTAAWLDSARANGCRVRQVVRWSIGEHPPAARVGLERTTGESPLGRVSGAGNVLQLTSDCGDVVCVQGVGAGRWPTTSAVVADLLDLDLQRRHEPQRTRCCRRPRPLAQPLVTP